MYRVTRHILSDFSARHEVALILFAIDLLGTSCRRSNLLHHIGQVVFDVVCGVGRLTFVRTAAAMRKFVDCGRWNPLSGGCDPQIECY